MITPKWDGAKNPSRVRTACSIHLKTALSLLLLTALTFPASAALDLADWKWEAPLTAEVTHEGFVRVVLTPEILDQSESSLSDLRVLDENGHVVPFVVHWGRVGKTEREDWRIAAVLNRVFQPGEYARVTLDFGEPTGKNLLKTRLSGANYRRKAVVEGSSDGQQWSLLLEDGWLFDISLPGQQFRADTLPVPQNDFRYLQLTVFNMEDDPRRIEIEQVETVQRRQLGDAEVVEVPVVAVKLLDESGKEDYEKDQTIYELDLGFANLPVATLKLDVADPYFHRAYEILGRNDTTEEVQQYTETGWDLVRRAAPWRMVARGVFYRIRGESKTSESLTAERLDAPYRHLRIRIFDQDNPPLTIDTQNIAILRREVSLVFDSSAEHRYRLVGGNPKAAPPRFDLAVAVQDVAEVPAPLLRAGTPTPIALPAWPQRYDVAIWAALALAVGVVAVLLIANLNKLRKDQGPKLRS